MGLLFYVLTKNVYCSSKLRTSQPRRERTLYRNTPGYRQHREKGRAHKRVPMELPWNVGTQRRFVVAHGR